MAPGSLVELDLLAQDGQGEREDRRRGALHDAADDQPGEGTGGGGEHRARDHHKEDADEGGLLAVLVAEAAEQRGEDGGREQRGGGHPTDVRRGGVEVGLDDAQDRDDQGLHHRDDHGGKTERQDEQGLP